MVIMHIDVNSAFLSWSAVNLLKNGYETDLRTIPSIIGGDSSSRHGIVLAKSIPAGRFGISTAEPIISAMRKCPNLHIEKPDFKIYKQFSHAFIDYLHTFTPDIEQVSIDECYLDFTPIAHLYPSPMTFAQKIQKEIYELFGFTVNVGISDKKVLAKMASDFEKPFKIHTLYTYEIQKKMWPLPIGNLYMCGKASASTLYKLGIRTIGDLANSDIRIIESNLKSIGTLLHNFANGIDSSQVETSHEPRKGLGHAITLSQDATTRAEAIKILDTLSKRVAYDLRKEQMIGCQVTTELKYADFTKHSAQHSLAFYTSNESDIYENAIQLFDGLWDESPIRLIGIRVGKLQSVDEPVQMSIFDLASDNNKHQKLASLDKALDDMRHKYGEHVIKKGL